MTTLFLKAARSPSQARLTCQRIRRRRTRQLEKYGLQPLEPRTLLSAWNVEDHYQLTADANASPSQIVADSLGNLYTTGWANDNAAPVYEGAKYAHAIVREKLAGTTAWTTILDYADFDDVPATGTVNTISGIAIDKFNNVFVTVIDHGSFNDTLALVLERKADQSAFSVIDTRTDGLYHSITADASGNVFAAGSIIETVGGVRASHWVVRKLAVGKTAFTTVDDFAYRNKQVSTYQPATGIAVIDSGAAAGIYVFGAPIAYENWVVRKSSDGGKTWKTVEDFDIDATNINTYNLPRALAPGADGSVYVVGVATYGNTQHWIVRKSASGNAGTWSTDFDIGGTDKFTNFSSGNRIIVDSSGNLLMTGQSNGQMLIYTKSYNAHTKKYGSWSLTDQIDSPDGRTVAATGLAFDNTGKLYLAVRTVVYFTDPMTSSTAWYVLSRPLASPATRFLSSAKSTAATTSSTRDPLQSVLTRRF